MIILKLKTIFKSSHYFIGIFFFIKIDLLILIFFILLFIVYKLFIFGFFFFVIAAITLNFAQWFLNILLELQSFRVV